MQVIISGLTVFLLYRYLLETIGAAELGIWALVLAASSTVQAANLGMTGSIIKHIADYDAQSDPNKIGQAVQTAAVSIGLFSMIFAVLLFPAAHYYFRFALDDPEFTKAIEILPQALLAFWVYMVSGIYQSALYGCQLITHRNAILVIDSVLYMLMCFILAPVYGLPGLAWARLAQNLITYFLSAFFLKRHVKQVPFLPRVWKKPLFKEMFGYAVNFQIIAILVMLSDPVTKGFLSRYGNVSMVAYYEMASKLVQLFRAILVNANQVLVPSYARFKQLDESRIVKTYKQSYGMMFFFAVPGFCFLAVAAPLISVMWVGRYEPDFITAMVLLCGGWLVNALGVPAYHVGFGTGNMKDNVLVHVLMTFSNVALILIIGKYWQGMGVVVAWPISLAIGGLLLILLYHMRNSLKLKDILPRASHSLVVISLVGTGVSLALWHILPELLADMSLSQSASLSTQNLVNSAIPCAFVILVAVPMWLHPVRSQLAALKRGSS